MEASTGQGQGVRAGWGGAGVGGAGGIMGLFLTSAIRVEAQGPRAEQRETCLPRSVPGSVCRNGRGNSEGI